MDLRWLVFLIIIPFLIHSAGTVGGDISHPHWSPETPVEGEEILLYILVTEEGLTNETQIRAFLDGRSFLLRSNDENGIKNGSAIFQGIIDPLTSGEHNITIQILNDDQWLDHGDFKISIYEKDDKKEDTILGFPKWYCSISIIILTVIVIFFTWSYFKGRSLQKKREIDGSNIKIECSDCGKPIGKNEKFCPWCGVDLDEEEYICGKCSKPVPPDVDICPACNTKLILDEPEKSGYPSSHRKKDLNGTIDQKRIIDRKGKKGCKKCGAVLMDHEMSCPLCGEEV